MKTIKRILGLILIAAIVAVSFVIWQGYEMYSKAIAEVSVEEKAAEIMEKDHYTITQQLGRIMYFSQEKKYSRKVAEVLVAGRIEEIYEKDKIFELYVNTIYFGSGYYSIYDASMGYFGKAPSQMNDYECTMLAGIPNAPSVYSPDVNPTLAEQRRQQVLTCMAEAGYIEPGEIE